MNTNYPSILDELGLGEPVTQERVGGGCIADARIVSFRDGSKVFMKSLSDQVDMFLREAEGLQALAAAQAIRVPAVLAVGAQSLVLEMIRSAAKKPGFAEDFGHRFAQLHKYRGKACGFAHDNYIGATRQRNDPLHCSWNEAQDETGSQWPAFFVERRLRFQVQLATSRGHGQELEQLLDRAETRIMDLLSGAIEAPGILHGDLWGGNYMVDDRGEACLIDPAVYYGHREADLAMTRLFGGFDPSFYSAYEESMPLLPGHRERLPIYQLYHVLNHLNLFGGGYYDQARRILKTLAS